MSSFRPQSSRELSPSLHIIYIFDLKVSEDVKRKECCCCKQKFSEIFVVLFDGVFFKEKIEKKKISLVNRLKSHIASDGNKGKGMKKEFG